VVSELVTNAVLHARTDVVLSLELRPGVARIGVRDGSLATLAIRNYSAEAITGRGLGVVEALSRAWGAVADRDGKLVWAEFDLAGAKTVDAPPLHFTPTRRTRPRSRAAPKCAPYGSRASRSTPIWDGRPFARRPASHATVALTVGAAR
jgi:hypothetical protein